MGKSKYKIYQLLDPNTHSIRYVGFTTKELNDRLSEHIKESKRGKKSYKCRWIRILIRGNKIPIIKCTHIVNKNNWQYWEKYYIAKYRKLGYKLTNLTDGGDGTPGRKVSLKERKRISKLHKGNTHWLNKAHTKITKLKMSKSRKANITQEFRDSVTQMNLKRLGKLNPRSTQIKGINLLTGKSLNFISYRDAEIKLKSLGLGARRDAISKHINGHYKSNIYKGFKWVKVDIK